MKVTLQDGTVVKIWFEHASGKMDGRIVEYTILLCELNGREDRVYRARVTRYYKDTPNRPASRRRVVQKFLKMGCMYLSEFEGSFTWDKDRAFSRADRGCIWEAYFKQHSDLRRGRKAKKVA